MSSSRRCGRCALLWLARVLYFILKLLEPLCDDPKMELSKCVLVGYDVSLKPHHGMIVKCTFSVAVKAASSRTTFMWRSSVSMRRQQLRRSRR